MSTATFSTSPAGAEALIARWWSSGRPLAGPFNRGGLSLFASWAVTSAGLTAAEVCRTMSWSTRALDRLLQG